MPAFAEPHSDPRENVIVSPPSGKLEGEDPGTRDRAWRQIVRKLWARRALLSDARVISTLAVGVACVMLGFQQDFFLSQPSDVAFDEGYTAALGERMIEGRWLPYVDGVSHRGPLLYWAVAIFERLFGRFDWSSLRWLSVVLTFWTLFATFATGVVARLPIAGAVAALAYVFSLSVFEPASAYGIIGETVASPLIVSALCLTTLAVFRLTGRRSIGAALLAAGICAGMAGLAKQTSLGVSVPLALWAVLHLRNMHGWTRRHKLEVFAAFAGGVTLPIAIVLIRYALAGELATFWYWYYEYNAKVYMRPYEGQPLKGNLLTLANRDHWPLLAVGLTMVALLTRALASFGKSDSAGFQLTLALLMLVSVIGAIAPLRFFFHYYLPVVPLGALGAGLFIAEGIRDGAGSERWRRFAAFFGLLATSLLTLYVHDDRLNDLRRERRTGGWASLRPEPVCDYLDKNASPEAPVFIWGFDADFYITCKRMPASRFVYLTMVAGTVPGPWWSNPRPAGVARGARSQLLDDLDKTKPPVILELTGNLRGAGMSVFPELHERVQRDYCQQASFKSRDKRVVVPWLKKENDACPSG